MPVGLIDEFFMVVRGLLLGIELYEKQQLKTAEQNGNNRKIPHLHLPVEQAGLGESAPVLLRDAGGPTEVAPPHEGSRSKD